jgi:hypothetical protein
MSESSLRRTDRRIAIAALLAGCMRIYPDLELPDLEVSWYIEDCADTELALALIGVDADRRYEARADACDMEGLALVDLARERYRLEGTVIESDGTLSGSALADVDLRAGNDDRAFLFLGAGYLNIGWRFEMGATCGSLGADVVAIELAQDTSYDVPCSFGSITLSPGPGTYTIRLRALAGGTPVAASDALPGVVVRRGFVDLGTITLVPCAGVCPGE